MYLFYVVMLMRWTREKDVVMQSVFNSHALTRTKKHIFKFPKRVYEYQTHARYLYCVCVECLKCIGKRSSFGALWIKPHRIHACEYKIMLCTHSHMQFSADRISLRMWSAHEFTFECVLGYSCVQTCWVQIESNVNQMYHITRAKYIRTGARYL